MISFSKLSPSDCTCHGLRTYVQFLFFIGFCFVIISCPATYGRIYYINSKVGR